jgi:hypothetical protein
MFDNGRFQQNSHAEVLCRMRNQTEVSLTLRSAEVNILPSTTRCVR